MNTRLAILLLVLWAAAIDAIDLAPEETTRQLADHSAFRNDPTPRFPISRSARDLDRLEARVHTTRN